MHVLITPRLTLRQVVKLDAEDIALWLSNWTVTRMLVRVPFPYAQTDANDWIAGLCRNPGAMVYTIHRERLIGVVSIEGKGAEPDLGFWLAEAWHGYGFMTEAAQRVIRHAFATRNFTSIHSSALVDNPASLRVQRKLGFNVCGGGSVWSTPRNEMVGIVRTRLTRRAFAAGNVTPMAAKAPEPEPEGVRLVGELSRGRADAGRTSTIGPV